MSARGARARRAAKQKTIGAVLLTLVVAVVIGVIVWKTQQPPLPTALLCPADGPRAHIAFLVDKTDPLGFTQSKALAGLLETFASGRRVREGELLSVYALGQDFRKDSEPLFEKCNPGDGRDKSGWKDNPELWKKRFDTEFKDPILRLQEDLKALQPAAQSPIMEMIQHVGLHFARHDVKGPRRLVILSDMLHNTTDYSMYVEEPDFGALQKRPRFQKLRAKLRGADVEILVLLNRPQIQNRRLTKFWEDYLEDAGAKLQAVDFAPG